MRLLVVMQMLVGCILLSQSFLLAAPAATQASWPQSLVVTVGDVRTSIDGSKMWTLSGIDFENEVMAVADSAYGTVLTIRNVGHLGTAHFLDVPGQPGEVEKEEVTGLRVWLDEEPLSVATPQASIRGKSFRMDRTSRIRSIDLKSSISLREGVLVETVHLHATGPIDLEKAHPTMYAWTPAATRYAFGSGDRVDKRGVFLRDGETVREVVSNVRWVAVFNPSSGRGGACCLLKHPAAPETSFLLIDAPGVYRKVAIHTLVDQVVPAGFGGTYQTAVGFFSSPEADWESEALRCIARIKATVAAHDEAESLPGSPAPDSIPQQRDAAPPGPAHR